MTALAELELPHLPMDEPRFAADPMPYLAEAKTQHPWLAKSAFGLVVTEYKAMRELLVDDKRLRPSYDGIVQLMGAEGTPWGRFTEEQMIALPTDQHAVLRGLFAPRFTPRYPRHPRIQARPGP